MLAFFFETHMLTFSFFESLMPKRSRARIHIFVFFVLFFDVEDGRPRSLDAVPSRSLLRQLPPQSGPSPGPADIPENIAGRHVDRRPAPLFQGKVKLLCPTIAIGHCQRPPLQPMGGRVWVHLCGNGAESETRHR